VLLGSKDDLSNWPTISRMDHKSRLSSGADHSYFCSRLVVAFLRRSSLVSSMKLISKTSTASFSKSCSFEAFLQSSIHFFLFSRMAHPRYVPASTRRSVPHSSVDKYDSVLNQKDLTLIQNSLYKTKYERYQRRRSSRVAATLPSCFVRNRSREKCWSGSHMPAVSSSNVSKKAIKIPRPVNKMHCWKRCPH
jgi:hypothetical protein